VAEAQGNIESAKGYYEAVIARVGDQYPTLAVQARIRLETLDTLVDAIDLPSDVEVTARNNQVLRRNPDPVNTMIEALNNITDAGGE